ncbi:transposase [Streptomyces bottropensis ATCC 25435]|uniref:Transposase n=1 Tax=Streptomyces bottropensis ATCC 25435 TaxID=1054862 RepID=M3FXK6_9ACTN|nr:transposase [Streptomyces bottropensis ATCC 25435]
MIAQLVQADEGTVRDVVHRFNGIGLACLDPRWVGGRPRLPSPDDEDFVVQTATTRPTQLGRPFTRWSIRKLPAHLRKVRGRVIRIGREALCTVCSPAAASPSSAPGRGRSSPDLDREVKLDRIEEVRQTSAVPRKLQEPRAYHAGLQGSSTPRGTRVVRGGPYVLGSQVRVRRPSLALEVSRTPAMPFREGAALCRVLHHNVA